MKRVTGFEPVSLVWETSILPLDDARATASDTSGGIRTLAVRLRGGCSSNELRRRLSVVPVASGRYDRTTTIQSSVSVFLSGYSESNRDLSRIRRVPNR